MNYFFNLLILILVSCEPALEKQQNDKRHYIDNRSYILDLPKNFDKEKSYHLLLAFHGANSYGHHMKSQSNFNDVNYIYIYPDAQVENWEEGCKCNKPYRLGIDDIGFFKQLVEKVKDEYKISKVYGVGFSQGGLFVHNVANRLSDLFTAVASVASPMSLPLSKDIDPDNEISILMIHGMRDSVLPYNGQNNGSFSLISSPSAIKIWADENNCDFSNTNENEFYIESNYSNTNKTIVKLISIKNGGHSWSYSGYNTSNEIISFFNTFN